MMPSSYARFDCNATDQTRGASPRLEVANLPAALRELPQWFGWREDPPERPGGKPRKVPINPKTGRKASVKDPATWGTLKEALAAVTRYQLNGIGFVFAPAGGIVGIDQDDCRNPDTGELTPEAQATVDRFPDVYWEVSVNSGGLHGIGYGSLPIEGTGKHPDGIGAFQHGRYFVMTGDVMPGHETMGDFGPDLETWYGETFAPEPETPAASPTAAPTADDDELLERARTSRNGPAFITLYDRGDTSAYTKANGESDHSGADLALMNALRFWTCRDPERMERLFTASALGQRDKWRKRADYRKSTIARALPGETWSPPTTARIVTREPTNSPPPHDPPPAFHAAAAGETCDAQLAAALARITELEATVTHERALRVAAEERADRLNLARSPLMQILKNPDWSAGQKLTLFATALDLGARIANGEQPTADGFRLPAKRIADNTGQKPEAVRRHWNASASDKVKVLEKKNVRETTNREGVDPETGEIVTATGLRDVTHIQVPENNITLLIARAASYRKTDPEARGGKREPRCKDHPDAGTLTTTITTCVECHAELDRTEPRYHAPDLSGAKIEPEKERPTPSVVNVYSVDTFAPEKSDSHSSPSKFEPDPRTPTSNVTNFSRRHIPPAQPAGYGGADR